MIRLAIFLMALVAPVAAQETAQEWADFLTDRKDTPGVVVAWSDGTRRQIAVSGLRRQNDDVPVELGDKWHVGSIGKSMTATLAARLVAHGKMAWDDTIADYLEGDPAWAETDLVSLLTHRSGMSANLGRIAVLRLDQGPRAEYVAQILAEGPEHPVGDFRYSNAAYVVAAAMMERATGTSWETLMQREVFEPLGLRSAGFGPPQGAQPEGHARNWARLLRPVGQGPDADNIPSSAPAGAVHLNASDMLTYLEAHLREDRELLPSSTWDILHRPNGEYALGWSVRNGQLAHSGSNTVWLAQVLIDLQRGRVGFVAANAPPSRGLERAMAVTLDALVAGGD